MSDRQMYMRTVTYKNVTAQVEKIIAIFKKKKIGYCQ